MSSQNEFTAKSVEAAIIEAEQRLGKYRDELEIQVLSQGSRGVFGIGSEPARIVVRIPAPPPVPEPEPVFEVPIAPAVAPSSSPPTGETRTPLVENDGLTRAGVGERHERPRQRAPQRHRRSERESTYTPRPPQPEVAAEVVDLDYESIARSAREIVSSLLNKMGFDAEVVVRSSGEPVTLDVLGDDLGLLIGRRGDSLGSLQFMVNVILSKQYQQWPHVVIDVQGYRVRREQSLSNLSIRVADRVCRNRRPFTLEAMPANDRRVIHVSLRDRSDIETYSVGEGASRRVVIAPKR